MSDTGNPKEDVKCEVVQRRVEALERERERLLAGFEEMKQAVKRAGRARSDFLTNMSHELRTPLSRIMGFTEVIREGMAGPVTDEQKEYLGDVYESAQQLHALINNILELSNAQTGRAELERRDLNVKSLLDSSVGLFREKAAKHCIGVHVHVAADIPALPADEHKLKQVLFHLLANAFKYTGDGGSVHMTARRTGNCVHFTVRDTGIGIAEEDQATLFEPFLQVGQTLPRTNSGTGLGLSLCREYIELHGGRIYVDSRPRQGSAFCFTIPFVFERSRDRPECRKPGETGAAAGWRAGQV